MNELDCDVLAPDVGTHSDHMSGYVVLYFPPNMPLCLVSVLAARLQHT